MCIVSNIGDYWKKDFPNRYPWYPTPIIPYPYEPETPVPYITPTI